MHSLVTFKKVKHEIEWDCFQPWKISANFIISSQLLIHLSQEANEKHSTSEVGITQRGKLKTKEQESNTIIKKRWDDIYITQGEMWGTYPRKAYSDWSKSESIISLKKKNRIDWREWVSWYWEFYNTVWTWFTIVTKYMEKKIENPTCGGKESNPNIVHYCEVWMWPALMSTYYYKYYDRFGHETQLWKLT